MTRRRALVVAVLWAAVALSAPASARAGEDPGPDDDRPYALLLGDSNMYGAFGHLLRRQLRAVGYDVRIKGRPSSGLARPDFWDWPAKGRELVERYQPKVVIIIFGGNDGQRIRFADGAYKNGIAWDDEAAWTAEYARRLQALMTALLSGALPGERKVFVLSPTNRRPPKARARMRRIVALERRLLQDRSDIIWVDTFGLSSDGQGQYLKYGRDWHGRFVKLRRRDGIHLTKNGAFHLAYALHPKLAEHLGWPRYRVSPLGVSAARGRVQASSASLP